MTRPYVRHEADAPLADALGEHCVRLTFLVARGQANKVRVHFDDRYVEDYRSVDEMRRAGDDGAYDVFVASVPVPTRRLKYVFEVELHQGTAWYGELGWADSLAEAAPFQLPYLCRRDLFEVPAWTAHAVCYQIFPDRFARNPAVPVPPGMELVPWDAEPTPDNRFGGNLAGIRDKLDYLADLGVNLLYLTPIFAAGSNHKYDTRDYFEIDPQFGTKDDLRALVEAAHARGIRILLDAVFNHAGFEFAPFADVRRRGKASPYWDWFFIAGDHVDTERVNYETFATKLAYMPKLNVAHPEVERYLLDVATYWVREFDIDGWRLDVANEIDHVFWRRFRQAVKQVKPDALIIGEVWHNSLPWLRGDQFDGVMNYLFREASLKFFIERKWGAERFAQTVVRLLHQYPDAANRAMLNLLGSHDTPRLLTLAQGDAAAVLRALVFQFTYPGIPMVYYGDEVGMTGGPDPGCRRGMVWDEAAQNRTLREAVRALAFIRRQEKALAGTTLAFVAAQGQVVEYRRCAEDGQSALHIAINNGDERAVHHGEGELLFATSPQAVDGRRLGPGSAAVWRV